MVLPVSTCKAPVTSVLSASPATPSRSRANALVVLCVSASVKWDLMRVNDTAYDFLQWKACVKEVQALCAELAFPPWAADVKVSMELIAYEVLRVLWSHPFHRYAWQALGVDDI